VVATPFVTRKVTGPVAFAVLAGKYGIGETPKVPALRLEFNEIVDAPPGKQVDAGSAVGVTADPLITPTFMVKFETHPPGAVTFSVYTVVVAGDAFTTWQL
jgi:hypothetical protein